MTVHALTPARDRTPPHDLEAERSVLGGVLIKPTAMADVIAALPVVDDFFLPAHREIYAAMRALDKRGAPLDVIVLADELRVAGVLQRMDGGESYLLALSNSVPTAENIAHYARLVREKATLRRLIAACAEIGSRAHGDFGELDDFLAEAKSTIEKIDRFDRSVGPRRVSELVGHALDVIEAKGEAPNGPGIPLGIQRFDTAIGGLYPENLIVLAARPGQGKTSLALNTAVRCAAAGVAVLFFSLEMSAQELVERSIAFLAPPAPSKPDGSAGDEVTNGSVRRGRLNFEQWKLVRHVTGHIRTLPLWIDDKTMDADRIAAFARSWRAREAPVHDDKPVPPALVVVDYLQRMRGDRRNGREQEIAENARLMKTMARALKLPVLLLVQVNREREKESGAAEDARDHKMSDLRGSGEIEQEADVIVFVQQSPRLGRHLYVAKNRNDEVTKIRVDFVKEKTAFYDAPGPDPDPDDET